MSYDVRFEIGGELVVLDERHQFGGGTFAVGGTNEAWLNITYNYGGHFRATLGHDDGIRSLYGKTAAELIPVLERAVAELGTERDDDYWAPTKGNAGAALSDLLGIARLAPAEAVLRGD
jgi:hypothetical protein